MALSQRFDFDSIGVCVTFAFLPPQSEKLLLFDTVQSELEEKIRRLEEDRHSIDITSGSSGSEGGVLAPKLY